MRAGRLRRRIVLQQRVKSKNSTGEETWTWQDQETLFASIRPVRGREDFQAQQVQASATQEIQIRYCRHVTTEKRFVERSADSPPVITAFDIQSVIADERRVYQVCTCTVRIADGWRE